MKKRLYRSLVEAVRYAAARPCHRKNCGTVCLCGPCHARRVLPHVELLVTLEAA